MGRGVSAQGGIYPGVSAQGVSDRGGGGVYHTATEAGGTHATGIHSCFE